MTISISGVVWVVLYLILAGIIFGLLGMLIDQAPFMPAEWKPIARYVLLVLVVVAVIVVLLQLFGGGPILRAWCMTDRLKGCWVSFEHDIREDDVGPILRAIRCIRGVAGVESSVSDPSDWMARLQVKAEIRDKILQIMKDLG